MIRYALTCEHEHGFEAWFGIMPEVDESLRRIVQFALCDSDRSLYHNEPIWRDGTIVGETTSGMYGHTVGRSLAMGYVTNPDGVVDAAYLDATFEIEVAGDRLAAQASLQPFYDPKSLRVKA